MLARYYWPETNLKLTINSLVPNAASIADDNKSMSFGLVRAAIQYLFCFGAR